MFLRSFLIAVLCAALLGTTSACLTESQITSIFKKYNSAGKKKWAKATVRTCHGRLASQIHTP